MDTQFVCRICHRAVPNRDAGCPYCKSRATSPEGASALALGLVAAVMIGLMTVTGYLSAMFYAAEEARGHAHAEHAEQLAAAGDFEPAVAAFLEALVYAPDDAGYRLRLATALVELDRLDEAEVYLTELLSVDPTGAVPNLQLARIHARRGEVEPAAAFYRRAIYGQWPDAAAERRLQTRFELVRLFEDDGRLLPAAAELSSLLEEEPNDRVVANRTAWSLLQVGAADPALQVFADLIERDPTDAVAHWGLAEAEFAEARFLTARTHFRRALQLNPSLTHLGPRVELCDRIIELDPSVRGLGRVTRYERSSELLTQVVQRVEACVPGVGPPPPGAPMLDPAVETTRQAAVQWLDAQEPAIDEAADRNVAAAEELWTAFLAVCEPAVSPDDSLALLLDKLADR